MRKKWNQQQKYYFSDRLKKQLNQIPNYPLTIVEAPSGFGKTTAVQEYLKENLPHGACEYWYTCLGESAPAAWLSICELFSNINDKTADGLRSLKMPTMDTLFYMVTYIRDIHCHEETYLIIDNYQLVNCEIPCELMSVFSMHGNPNLHMIFITQQMNAVHQFSILNNNIYTIDSSAFFLDKEGTSNLFRMEGIHLNNEEVEKIYMSTEGWVSAIRLQIINYIESGSFDHTADIVHLVETAIWNRLEPEEQEFLFSVSIMESFSVRQASIMMEVEMLPEHINHLLKYNEFIRYIPDQHQYGIHSILRDYLLNRFYHEQPQEYQNVIFRKAGHAYAAISKYCPAAHFYYQVKDFDAILSLPFTCEYFEQHKDEYKPEFIETIIKDCPEDTICKYPFTLLAFGYQTYTCGQFEAYYELCRLLCLTIEKGVGFHQDELRKIKGEYMLLASMTDFNDLNKLKERHKTAWKALGGSSTIVKRGSLWGFATISVFNILWRKSGQLDCTLQQMDEMTAVFRKMTGGYGAGARNMLRAEVMLMRGEDDEAEILCHKALYEARSYKQTSLCLCAELTFARIAILRGDVEGYSTAIRNIQDYANQNIDLMILRIAEHCLSVISLLLDIKDYVAPWFYDLESIKKLLPAPVVPLAQILQLRLLLMDKRYNEFYGACQLALDTSKNSTGNIQYMIAQVYQLIYLAIAKHNNGKPLEAQQYLREALEAALPDQIYLPFAQQEHMEELFSLGCRNDSFTALMELCKRQRKGVSIIRKAIIQDKSPLTPREREMAQLAKERLSAKEIADKLYISEMTVKATLRSVYSKLDIHSKAELLTKKF
ncbi:LuxR C-terminal-related transcriptional regulator [Faecalicatena contorta]|uniref:LuxR family transcriptional regulator, maltose regulon positive regulatory protein n=1 Tax=Faecalicatena contorta TaxID=39482 RepID=A0A316ALM3_9FIRM|nr:LuxR C-terminal-related transcriptional regulator [Faecalicatena contorta]PWJ50927.1 LuxR family maltose regulon positive regulatory protein [Faecalicatena contorta]SUQ13495.1 LuxR family transcriptional regulator, maltose regulon positive regulatory protein [Faecalicatena contorta]